MVQERAYTLTLRKVLLCDYIYYFIFIVSIFFVLYKTNNYDVDYSYLDKEVITGVVTDIFISDSYVSFEIDSDFKVLGYYYIEEDILIDISLGDKVKFYGDIYLPSSNTNFNLFSYRDYLKSKNVYYMIFGIRQLIRYFVK